MTINYQRASAYLLGLLGEHNADDIAERLRPKLGELPPAVPHRADVSVEAVERRWHLLDAPEEARQSLFDEATARTAESYRRNVENFIGTAKVPVGLVGPLRVNGVFAQGDYYVPLATTEASLVASYNRGAHVVSEAGGVSAMLLSEGVARSPVFCFKNFEAVGRFIEWVLGHTKTIEQVAESTTTHGKLVDFELSVEGNTVYFVFVYTTGDAAGQNMVTIATDAAVNWITENSPVKPSSVYLEANFSGDKKASAQSLQRVRGRKVTAEVELPGELVEARLHTTTDRIAELCRLAAMGSILSGTLGAQGHYANGLTALFIACGQDAACVAEAAVGMTSMEPRANGNLYVSVTLPNLIVGTVGGGTALPTQRACLDILGLAGPGNARAFAEVAASLCLAGEISIVGAICAGEFARAHAHLARGVRLDR